MIRSIEVFNILHKKSITRVHLKVDEAVEGCRRHLSEKQVVGRASFPLRRKPRIKVLILSRIELTTPHY